MRRGWCYAGPGLRSALWDAAVQNVISLYACRAGWLRYGSLYALASRYRAGTRRELLYTGRTLSAEEGLHWGFFNALYASEELCGQNTEMATQLRQWPNFCPCHDEKAIASGMGDGPG